MSKNNIPEELLARIRGEAKRLNCRVLDMTASGRGTPLLQITLDKEGGITLDECVRFNKNLTYWIDQHEMFGGMYTLDVCSPGLDRELKTDEDFLWAEGKKVRITTYEPVEGKREIKGVLLKMDSGRIVVENEGREIRIDRTKIAKAKLNGEG